jgi:hypothetical protein
MPRTPEQQAQAQLDAYNSKDLEAFLACYVSDIESRAHPSGDLICRGHDGFRERYGPYFEANPDMHCELLHRMVMGNFVVDHERITGLADGTEKFAIAIYTCGEDLIEGVWFLRS